MRALRRRKFTPLFQTGICRELQWVKIGAWAATPSPVDCRVFTLFLMEQTIHMKCEQMSFFVVETANLHRSVVLCTFVRCLDHEHCASHMIQEEYGSHA